MIEEARSRAAAYPNVELLVGDALAMPFPDGAFDLATSGRTLHHLARPEAAIRELARVVRPGGLVLVVDQIAPDGPGAAALQERIETLRDPSHVRGLRRAELDELAASVGTIVAADDRDHDLPVEDWMERSRTPEAGRTEIRSRLRAELNGGEPTGMRPREGADGLLFTQSWRLLLVRVIAVPEAGMSAGDGRYERQRQRPGGP